MKDTNDIWRFSRYEKEELENKIRISDEFLRVLADFDKLEIWQNSIDLSQPSFEKQLQSLVLSTAIKIQRRRRSFLGRVFFLFIDFLFSFFTKPSIKNDLRLHLIDSDRSDFIDIIRSIVSERRESYIRVYKRLSKAARGGRIIDIRKSTRRFKFLRIYSNNIDEEGLIANLNMKIYY